MGRVVNWKDEKLSDEDREYLLSRGDRGAVAANDRMFGDGAHDAIFDTHSAHELNPDGHIQQPSHTVDNDAPQDGESEPEEQGQSDADREAEVRAKANKLTVEKLQEELDKREVEYGSDDRKAELVDKLTKAVIQEEQQAQS